MLTFEQLLEKKNLRDKDKKETILIKVPSLGDEIEFKRPKQATLLKAMESARNAEDILETDDIQVNFIFDHFPLSQQFIDSGYMVNNNIQDPKDIIRTLFTIADREEIMNKLAEAGGAVKVEETIKN